MLSPSQSIQSNLPRLHLDRKKRTSTIDPPTATALTTILHKISTKYSQLSIQIKQTDQALSCQACHLLRDTENQNLPLSPLPFLPFSSFSLSLLHSFPLSNSVFSKPSLSFSASLSLPRSLSVSASLHSRFLFLTLHFEAK